MRYELVGRQTKNVGKTLWEIVGNLKNFGVGRLVKKSSSVRYSGLSFFKIVKVQPFPPHKSEFENRRVIVWIDEIFNGRKTGVQTLFKNTELAKFQLIPKIEEEEYLKKAAALKPPIKYYKKYCFCPPLYKKLWEAESSKKEPMPKIKTITIENEGFEIVTQEEELQPSTCSRHKTNMTVDEMYKEIVRLKKIIKYNTDVQQ